VTEVTADRPAQPSTGQPSTGQPSTGQPSTGQPGSRGHRVLWTVVVTAAVAAALVAVIASAQPSADVLGQSPLVGNAAPSISGPGLAGGRYSLAQFRGRWVLVNFMATWCLPCQQEMPQLAKFQEQHELKRDATVFTVADDPSNVTELAQFLAAKGAHWPAVDDPGATVSYGVEGLPSSFLVAPDGVVYAYQEGEVNAANLDSLLAKAAAQGVGPA